jgi:predicted nuclease with TOPRIM domain
MSKRFTPKAATYTARLAEIQNQVRDLRAELGPLEEEERALKAHLMDFYEEGKTEVEVGRKTLIVDFSITHRKVLNQAKAKILIANLGKKVPFTSTDVVSFKVYGESK